MEQTKRKASAVTAQASAVSSGAKSIAKAAERQLEALAKAKDLVPSVTAATEAVLAALRCLSVVLGAPPSLGRESSRAARTTCSTATVSLSLARYPVQPPSTTETHYTYTIPVVPVASYQLPRWLQAK